MVVFCTVLWCLEMNGDLVSPRCDMYSLSRDRERGRGVGRERMRGRRREKERDCCWEKM